jgi:NADH:ubiquinone oxidoreductase subunit 5 (subunit L)/multisubunit Na+/H+ antiporter MnhA subunit
VFLLLRIAPLLAQAPVVRAAVGVVGALTALTATASGRAQSDAKNALSYATLTQVGLMFVEIAAGLTTIATVHMIANIVLRTYQFLRASSALQDAQERRAAAGGARWVTGRAYETALPPRLQRALYWLALDRFHLDSWLERFAAAPVLRLGRALDRFERWLTSDSPRERPPVTSGAPR